MLALRWACVMGLGAIVAGAGCRDDKAHEARREPLKVDVAVPLSRVVGDSEYYPGVFEAVDSVDIRAKVTGYLDDIPYLRSESFIKQGEVNKDDVLFLIDARPFEKTVERLEADAKALQAQVTRLETEQARNERLLPSGTISREDYDRTVASRLSTTAQWEAAKAQIAEAKLNLAYCRITARFTGRISRNLVSAGNLVSSNATLLTNLVSVDPIYVTFNIEERTLQRYSRMKREGKLKEDDEHRTLINVGLDDDPPNAYPHEGAIDFGDNRVDPTTGTYLVRAVFDNKNELFKPGYSARVRVPIGAPRQVLMINERAIGSDLDQKYVYVVGSDNKIAYRKVELGRLHADLRIIDEGLEPTDRVVVSGIQLVRPGSPVNPQVVPMPEQAKTSLAPEIK